MTMKGLMKFALAELLSPAPRRWLQKLISLNRRWIYLPVQVRLVVA
jgi:hypothetical protein